MRDDYPEFRKRGAEILAVAPDNPSRVSPHWERESIPFPGLADPRHKVSRAYGQAVRLLRLGRLPTIMILDRNGVVRYRYDGGFMWDFPPNADLLAVLDQLAQEEAAS